MSLKIQSALDKPAPKGKVSKMSQLEAQGGKVHYIQKVIKGETYLVMAQSAVELEDEFSNLYYSTYAEQNLFLQPPFDPNSLLQLVQTNNILNQCIEAMEVNIDGTGFEIVPIDDDKGSDKPKPPSEVAKAPAAAPAGVPAAADPAPGTAMVKKVDEDDAAFEAEKKKAESFFKEPYPNLTLTQIRRKLRRQMESVGYAFLEVLRNLNGEIVALRNVETPNVRMVKLDAAIRVKKKIERNGTEIELEIWERERRFCQMVALKNKVYYREYGTTRQIHRDTGHWEAPETPVKPEERGTELLVFGINPDTMTPYFLPRWINNLPAVVGSRQAEEQNLEFLNAGGMPPAIIFIQGGTLIKDASDQLKAYLSGQNKNKNRAVVVEVMSSSGSLDAASKVDVKTERFGAEQAKDSMFQAYDDRTSEQVRTSFRLPPLFLGKAEDYNFATAQTGYMVAEAQVFLPERIEFDDVMNKTILKEMGWKHCKFKSLPITLKDVTNLLKSLEISKDVVSRESFVKELNTAVGTSMEMSEVPAPNQGDDETPFETPSMDKTPSGKMPASTKPPAFNAKPPKVQEQVGPRPKVLPFGKKTAGELINLAQAYAQTQGLVRKADLPFEEQVAIKEDVDALSAHDRADFDRLVAQYLGNDADLVDLVANMHG